jgi:hypothetical protein
VESDDVTASEIPILPHFPSFMLEQQAMHLESQALELRANVGSQSRYPIPTMESAGNINNPVHFQNWGMVEPTFFTGASEMSTHLLEQHRSGGADLQMVATLPCVASMQASAPVHVPMVMDEDEYLRQFLLKAPKPTRNEGKPWQQRSLEKVASGASEDNTTLIFRNVPNRLMRDRLMELLDEAEFEGCYDFVYVPIDFHRNAGLGYAFVNFTNTENAKRAMADSQGFARWDCQTPKVCEVLWSTNIQGLSDHIERYRDSPVMHHAVPECFKPVILKNGIRQPFPPPTKVIRPPRVKRGSIREF